MAFKTETIKPDAYRALEDIVGPENVSQEPAVLDGYCFVWGNDYMFVDGDKYAARPLAAILPKSVEEVSAIVKACNRFKIPFKPMSTGFGPDNSSHRPYVCVDLRRMNRLLQIDEKNRIAVLEPYCVYGHLMTESNKKGLRAHVASPGPSASILASITSMSGNPSQSTGGTKDVLGLEWVLPNGEILRFGTADMGAGWFNADGPGPSLRGIVRGFVGHEGTFGIFTKIALKLYPWYGPPVLETTITPPKYAQLETPECFRFYMALFPTRQKLINALRMISEEGIAYGCFRRGPYTTIQGMTKSNEEAWEVWKTGFWQKRAQHNLQCCIESSSPREMEYREKLFLDIVDRFDGEMPDELNADTPAKKARFLYIYNAIGGNKSCFGAGTAFVEMATVGTLESRQKGIEIWYRAKEKGIKKGFLMDDGNSALLAIGLDGIGAGGGGATRYDPLDMNTIDAVLEMWDETFTELGKNNLEFCGGEIGPHPSVETANEPIYPMIEKIREKFGPKDLLLPLPARVLGKDGTTKGMMDK